ncbi:DUF7521 family protein [Haladaptatus sp. ZSTT2]|uniref:DUF7521 family protein n=1 Tax=Haladaptatus sp. ZSTT2 TaxID=3120515 RepID=UPI00300E86A0
MHIGLVVAKLLVVLIGVLIALQGYRAYLRETNARMLFVAVGFLLLSVGSVLEGIFYDVLHFSVFLAGMIQTLFVALGMALILYSLYMTTDATDTTAQKPDTPHEST